MTLLTPVMHKAIATPKPLQNANALFAYQSNGAAERDCPFPDTRRVTLPAGDGDFIGLEVVAAPGAEVETFVDPATGCCAYLWGLAGHPDLCHDELLQWIVAKVDAGEFAALRQVMGMFVVLIDDRRHRR